MAVVVPHDGRLPRDAIIHVLTFSWSLITTCRRKCRPFLTHCLLIPVASLLPLVSAQDANGTVFLTAPDNYVGDSQSLLSINAWMRRGINIRSKGDKPLCYATLLNTLGQINHLRAAEYNGAAGVLSLLPTIGALLGAPTNEVWRLWTVVPFGGVLTMLLSFGGAILPIKIEDYERDIAKGNGLIGSIVSFRSVGSGAGRMLLDEKLELLDQKLKSRMGQRIPRSNFNGTLAMGLLGMFGLLMGAHTAMAMVEQGGVLPWWCTSQWWMHLWYILVTVSSVAENWTQLPFAQQWRLFVSDVPYNVEIKDGDDIMEQLPANEDKVSRSLSRLSRLQAATVLIRGSRVQTRAVNTVMIMVSVVATEKPLGSLRRLMTKMSSIGVFVTGTAFFAAVQLLALPMAILVLTLILAAGVFGRGFANWIVTRIDQEEPLVHIIVKDTQEAHTVISKILELDSRGGLVETDLAEEGRKGGRLLQVEIGGHVFIRRRRVAHRSSWHVKTWGIMASPFDLRKVGLIINDYGFGPLQQHSQHFPTMVNSFHSGQSSNSPYQMVPLNGNEGGPPQRWTGSEGQSLHGPSGDPRQRWTGGERPKEISEDE